MINELDLVHKFDQLLDLCRRITLLSGIILDLKDSEVQRISEKIITNSIVVTDNYIDLRKEDLVFVISRYFDIADQRIQVIKNLDKKCIIRICDVDVAIVNENKADECKELIKNIIKLAREEIKASKKVQLLGSLATRLIDDEQLIIRKIEEQLLKTIEEW